MTYNEEILKSFFQNQKKQLEDLLIENIGLKNSISNIESGISKINNPELNERYKKHLVIAKTNLAINELNIHSITTLMNDINKLAISSGFQSLYNLNEELENVNENNSVEISENLIHQKFEELKNLYNSYLNESDLEKKNEIYKDFEKKKNNLSSLKSKFSCRMRNLRKNGKITEEEFKKFKESQIKYNKEHYDLYKKINEIMKDTKFEKEHVIETQEPNIDDIDSSQFNVIQNQESNKENDVQKLNVEETENTFENNESEPIDITINNALEKMNLIKESKTANEIINRVENALSAHNKTVTTSVEGTIEETKNAIKEERKAQSKLNINRNQELLKERDKLARELNEISQRYGSANNEEYQARLKQLKDIDKMIFGHKAKRIYKDFKKHVKMFGGSYIELPKAYINMRLEKLAKII